VSIKRCVRRTACANMTGIGTALREKSIRVGRSSNQKAHGGSPTVLVRLTRGSRLKKNRCR
jgi:hypothetical protein